MKKKSLMLLVFVFLLASVSAVSITNTTINSTKKTISVQNAFELYAYEINLAYTGSGTLSSAQFFRFLGSGTTSGVNQKGTTVSVYESILNSTHPGVNGSGNLFNISYPSGALTLDNSVLIFANGTEITINHTSGTVTIVDGGDDGGGGGGGGGAGSTTDPFEANPELLNIETFPGETVWEKIEIKNNKGLPIEITEIKVEGLGDILTVNEKEFSLGSKDSKEVNLKFEIPKNLEPDVYVGRVLFVSEEFTAILNVIVEVESVKGALFDVVVEFPDDAEFAPGEDVAARINIDNFGSLRGFDFNLFYAIKDFEGRTLASGEENIAIETKVELIRELRLPSDTPVGDYIFTAKASYEDAVASGSRTFAVRGVALSPFTGQTFLIILGVAVAVLIIIVVVVLHGRGKKQN